MTTRIRYSNPTAASAQTSATPAAAFHRTISGYRATPLTDFPSLAAEFGVGHVYVKDEQNRFGLPAFKALGASWAIARIIWDAAGRAGLPTTFDELRAAAQSVPHLTLVTATDGNHGRAVARVAAMLGLRARIFVPDGVSASARDAIRSEGADLIELPEIYDDAVRAAAASVDPATDRLVQDTSWDGYTDVPQWIVDGYSTLFDEVAQQASAPADLIVIPTGVGSLLQSAVEDGRGARLLCVEPTTAACVAASLSTGHPVTVDTSAPTAMAGLNCGSLSEIAWPHLQAGVTAAVVVDDDQTAQAAAELATGGVHAGPCGAASLAGLRVAWSDPEVWGALGLTADSTIVLVSTESSLAIPSEGLTP